MEPKYLNFTASCYGGCSHCISTNAYFLFTSAKVEREYAVFLRDEKKSEKKLHFFSFNIEFCRRTAWFLQFSLVGEAVEPVAGHDDMVHEGEAEYFGGFFGPGREFDVLAAGLRLARGVVVAKGDGGGFAHDGGAHEEADVHGRRGETALADTLLADDG